MKKTENTKTEKEAVSSEKRKIKPTSSSSTSKRLSKLPNIVTKDTNDVEVTAQKVPSSFYVESVSLSEIASGENPPSRGIRLESDKYNHKPLSKSRKLNVNSNIENARRIEAPYEIGLTSNEVSRRIDEGYVNLIKKNKGKSYGRIVFNNIFTFFNMLTFVVAGALIAVGAQMSQLFFLVIILANIALGLIQEIKSKLAVDKLSIVTAPSATVIRDGAKSSIPTCNVVLDDVMYLEMGKQISADGIVLKGEIEVNESMLTGESVPVKKSVGGEVFSGSFVTSGSCYVRVNKVGAANYIESLSEHARKYRKPKSELQNSIRLIIKVVTFILIPVTILLLMRNYNILKELGAPDLWNQVISNVSGAVIGMIPAGMFLLTSTALSVSVIRLSKKRTLVQDLYCIEMLARVDVLCLDKTGTITDGSMQVNNVIEIKGSETQNYTVGTVIGNMLSATEDNNQTAMALANRFGYSQSLKPLTILPFSSQRKLSAVTFEGAGTYMLGAPEYVLKDMGVRIEKIVNENAENGYRVMVLAHSPADIVGEKLPAMRRPICLIVIEDHIREDAYSTIKWFKENSVAVRVISGDNPITVSEVAKRVGVENAQMYISLDGLSNQEVEEAADRYTVFGRVTPEQKSLLIKALKKKGHTVAMTGDGVNDILAMREADCSVAIASGSDAARNVAHLVLQNSSFTSMPDVVMEGRRVINNIQKSSSLFLMKTFMSMALSIIFVLMGKPYPFTTANLLLMELLVIGLPSFVLALQKNTNIIRGKFLSNVIGRCIPGGITLVAAILAAYFYYTVNYGAVSDNSPALTSIMVLVLTYTGMIILYKNCEPFDGVRSILMVGVSVASFLLLFAMPDTFGVIAIPLVDKLLVATIVLASYFFVSIMMKIMRFAKVLN